MKTNLALPDCCVDAAWLNPAPGRLDRFIVLDGPGFSLHLYDKGGQQLKIVPLHGAPGQPPGPSIYRSWACSPVLLDAAGTGMLLHAAFLPAANAEVVVVAASSGQAPSLACRAGTVRSTGAASFYGIPGWSPQARGQMLTRQEEPINADRVQVLAYSHARNPRINTQDNKLLRLQVGERIFDVIEQPLDLPYKKADVSSESMPSWDYSLLWCHHKWEYRLMHFLPMLLIHTNYRVLIVNTDLQILACRQTNRRLPTVGSIGFDSALRTCGSGAIISATWLGNTVVCLHDDGVVDYLLPPKASTSSNGQVYPLLTIAPSTLLARGGATIVSIRPDRLLLVATAVWRKRPMAQPRLLTRIFLPFEPLVVGLVTSLWKAEEQIGVLPQSLPPRVLADLQQRLFLRVRALHRLINVTVCRNAPPLKLGDTSAVGEGLGINAGSSRFTFRSCLDLGLLGRALAAAGVGDSTHHRGGEQYPLRPWLSIKLQSAVAAETRLWSIALLEIMADHPDLYRAMARDSNNRNVALPLPHSTVSTRFHGFAWAAALAGAFHSAKRAWDLAGDGPALVNLGIEVQSLFSPSGFHGTGACTDRLKHHDCRDALDLVPRVCEGPEPVCGATLCAIVRILEEEARHGEIHGATLLPFCRLSFPARRYELLPVSGELVKAQSIDVEMKAASSGQLTTRAMIDRVASGNQYLKYLRLKCAEEWFGRARPESLGGNPSFEWVIAMEHDGAGEVVDSGGAKHGWEKAIGAGKKDEANLVGYWRFGEGMKAPPIDRNVEIADAPHKYLMCPSTLQDISGYGGTIKVIADIPGAITLTACTCSRLDGGDESSTHVAYDIVFHTPPMEPKIASSSSSLASCVLVIPIKRGGPLDVGLFHEDPHRSNLTIEFWIKILPLARNKKEDGECDDADHEGHRERPLPFHSAQVLVCRQLRTSKRTLPIWSLQLLGDGTLSVALSTHGEEQRANSRPRVIEAGKWSHIALVLSTRNSSRWTFKDPTADQPMEIILYVDGEEVVQSRTLHAQLRTPFDAEAFERQPSEMLLGPNLSYGSRITDLRFWACRRKQNDILASMENYLPQASKKRIKKFVIKEASTTASRASFALNSPPSRSMTLQKSGVQDSAVAQRDVVK